MEKQQGKDPNASLDSLIHHNIETVKKIEEASKNSRGRGEVVADAIAAFCGSTAFLWVHCAWFGLWLMWNGLPSVPKSWKFDPLPFSFLTLVVSLEAIFLSTFILISQNRQQLVADRRNHLDLQINLLAEQESSQVLLMLDQIMDKLGIEKVGGGKVTALEEETDPRSLISELEKHTS